MPLVLQAVHSPPDSCSCSCSKWDLSFRDAHSHSPQERGGGARTEQRLLRPSLSALRTRAEAMTGGRAVDSPRPRPGFAVCAAGRAAVALHKPKVEAGAKKAGRSLSREWDRATERPRCAWTGGRGTGLVADQLGDWDGALSRPPVTTTWSALLARDRLAYRHRGRDGLDGSRDLRTAAGPLPGPGGEEHEEDLSDECPCFLL